MSSVCPFRKSWKNLFSVNFMFETSPIFSSIVITYYSSLDCALLWLIAMDCYTIITVTFRYCSGSMHGVCNGNRVPLSSVNIGVPSGKPIAIDF